MNSRQLARKWPYPRRNRFVSLMRRAAEKWFEGKDCNLHPKYKYCLADWNDWHHNIIQREVAEYIEGIRKERTSEGHGFALHDYVHHGLSSQALLFNLIVPLIVRQDLESLHEVLRSKGMQWPSESGKVTLEYEDRQVFNEDSGQPTSIDLVIGDPEKPGALFIECKFTESGFGGCSVFEQGDCEGSNPISNLSRCYLHYIGRMYWERLKSFEFIKGALSTDSTCILANHYQFFREILFSLYKGGTFILLYDDRSPTFSAGDRGLMPLLLNFVPDKYKDRIGQISIQDLVISIDKSGTHSDWIGQFKSKYGIDDS